MEEWGLIDGIASEELMSEKSVEEFQIYGDKRDGEYIDTMNDKVSVWIGKTEADEYYIGVAGRNYRSFDGKNYFRTAGFQEISEKEYNELLKCKLFQRTRGKDITK